MIPPEPERFTSRLGLLLSVLGIAVGTGNIWRFPRIAAQSASSEGAGAFLLAWVVFLFLWSIPLIIAEYALGRAGRRGVVGTFAAVGGERLAWMGAFVGVVALAIMFYYSVVAGWCMAYLFESLRAPLPLSAPAALSLWEHVQAPGRPVFFHALAMVLGGAAVWRGIASIERLSKVLIPALLVIVLLCLLRSVTLDGAAQGLLFLFTPDWSALGRPELWLEALTQNAWDTGAGWGLILTYAAYMRNNDQVVKSAFATGIGNNLVSIVAAMTIFGTVFALLGHEMNQADIVAVMRESGPASTGLTFVWMPQLFARMPLGQPLAVLFFLGLSVAALTSLVSMIELGVRMLVDVEVPRRRAVVLVTGVGFLLGLPSALSVDFLSNQDFVWGVALIISGAFIAFTVVRHGVVRFRTRIIGRLSHDWQPGPVWDALMRFGIPLQAGVLLLWWLYLSATTFAPEGWADPFEPYSVMTCLLHWGVAVGLCLALNRWFRRRLV